MELKEAITKADLILDQERKRPTVEYQRVPTKWEENASDLLSQKRPQPLGVERYRKGHPREVYGSPELFKFKSENYEYLVLIFGQVYGDDKKKFIDYILARMRYGDAGTASGNQYPSFDGLVSEMPLVAEFAIRAGYGKLLVETIYNVNHVSKGMAILLLQVEDTLAFNFNLFSDDELQIIPIYLSRMEKDAHDLTDVLEFAELAVQVVAIIEGIKAECEQARYHYLTGALRQLPNLEIDQDKKRVEGYLSALGFSPLMQQALDEAESDYRADASGFELKNALTHLRTFFEQLHFQVGHLLSDRAGRTRDTKFGQVLTTLRVLSFFSEKEEKFAGALYGLLSDEGVHALIAKKEYARLMRNMVIEYGVMFLSIMKEKGIKLAA